MTIGSKPGERRGGRRKGTPNRVTSATRERIAHYTNFGEHAPAVTNIGGAFDEVYDSLPDNAGRGGIGTPEQVRRHLEGYEKVGLDQIIFVQQSGRNRHADICESLELFAKAVQPAFKAREAKRQAEKQAELAPFVAAALKRKGPVPQMPLEAIPTVASLGRRREQTGGAAVSAFVDKTRGGAIPIPHADPRRKQAGGDD